MHVHINDWEVQGVALFRIGGIHPLRMNVFGRMVEVSIAKINQIDARAASCPQCNERVEQSKKVIEGSTFVNGSLHITVNEEKLKKFQSGEIPFEALLFSEDAPD